MTLSKIDLRSVVQVLLEQLKNVNINKS